MINKPFNQLQFSDDFMFCKVLQTHPELCKELIELILGMKIGEIVRLKDQYPIKITNDGRGVRFDVFAQDSNSVIYDIEMQKASRDHLPKRTRYSQSMIDMEMLEQGTHFSNLHKSYVIFICQFNLFPNVGLHRYSFRRLCLENRLTELGDDTETIFLCTKGTANDISRELRQFLDYLNHGIAENIFTAKLDDAVGKARRNPRWRAEYMDLQDYIDDSLRDKIEELDKTRDQLNKARSELTTARSELTTAKSELTSTRSELTSTRSELTSTRSELNTAHSALDAAHIELNAAHFDLDSVSKELDNAHMELNTAHSDLDVAHIELDAAHSALDAARSDLDSVNKELDVTHSALNVANKKLDAAQKQVDIEKMRADAAEEECKRLRALLEEAGKQ